MIKQVKFPLAAFRDILRLPENVEVAAVRQVDNGYAEFIISDPQDVLKENSTLKDGQWVSDEKKSPAGE